MEKRLLAHNWNVTKAAESFKMEQTHLSRKIKELGVRKRHQTS
ncbi:MAG: hypothetical protein ACE5OR_13465 [bacterium]